MTLRAARQRAAQTLRNRHVLSLGGRGVAAASGLLTFMVLARLLGPDGLGTWILYLATASFLHMCRHGLVKQALIRAVARCTATEPRRTVVGAGWVLALLVTAVASAGVAAVGAVVPLPDGFGLFVRWYPLLAWATLPLHVATWLAEADDRFDRPLWLNTLRGGSLLLGLGVLLLLPAVPVTPDTVAGVHLSMTASTSLLALGRGWTAVTALPPATRSAVRRLADFGRYSVGTLIGTHLLTSSDTYLLGLLVGPAAVGIYGVAQKAVRLILIPLRAFSATAYPTLSRLSAQSRTALSRYAHRWVLLMTGVLLPVLVALAVEAERWVRWLGGPSYDAAAPVLQWFALYLALAPLDRMIGMLFDSIRRPQYNLVKVGLMLGVNVAGDVLVLYALDSVAAVAAVTTLTLATGVAAGQALLPPPLRLRLHRFHRAAHRLWARLRRAKARALADPS